MKKKLIAIAVTGAVLTMGFKIYSNGNINKNNNAIYEPPQEKTYIADIISSAVAMVTHTQEQTSPAPFRRDVHAKAHGCVKATFTVPELNDPLLRQGIFAEPKEFQAWIRYSSGDTKPQPDDVKDARGMAIKVMGVPGKKLIKSEQDQQTQDFVMINNDVFFIRTVEEYSEFMQYQARGSKFGYFFDDFNINVFKWHFRDLYLGAQTLKKAPKSLLTEQYHSLSAYRFGNEQFMKYSAKACDTNVATDVDRDDNSFLRAELKQNLAENEACFDFMVQIQNPEKNMPIEDTTIRWKEKDSAFKTVARVTIPKQTFDSNVQNQFCENLSFTPWHAIPELEPVGGINRLRKAVYNEVSRFRHGKNDTPRQEPQGWCLALDGRACPTEEL